MVVCHCFRISDRAVRSAVRSGTDSVEALGRLCGAGSDCGGCWPALEELLDELAASESLERVSLAS